MMLIFLLVSLTISQWVLLDEDSPPFTSTSPDAQPNPQNFAALWCASDDSLYLFGDSLWKFEPDIKRWFLQCPPSVKLRQDAAYWTLRNKFYVFGGISAENGQTLNDMQVYDPRTRVFQKLGNHPFGGCSGSAFWTHAASNRLYLWGGSCEMVPNVTTTVSTLQAFDVNSLEWTTIATHPSSSGAPEGALHAAAALGRSEDVVYLYTGDKLWQLDLGSFTWSQSPISSSGTSPPGPFRIYPVVWKSPNDDSIMLYGGQSGSKIYSDTWAYSVSGKRWTQKGLDGPGQRWGSAYCTNPQTGELHLFGGGEVHNDCWKYGSFNIRNLFQQIQFKIDSATVSAFAAAILSGFSALGFIFLAIAICVLRCKRPPRGYTINAMEKLKEEDGFGL